MDETTSGAVGTLLLRVAPNVELSRQDHVRPVSVAVVITELALVADRVHVAVRSRPVELRADRVEGSTFVLVVPAARYEAIRMGVRRVDEHSVATVTLDGPFEVPERGATTVTIAVDVERLGTPGPLDLRSAATVVAAPEPRAEAIAVAGQATEVTLEVAFAPRAGRSGRQRKAPTAPSTALPALPDTTGGSIGVFAAEGALAPGTSVLVRLRRPLVPGPLQPPGSLRPGRPSRPPDGAPAPGGLPPLFRRQVAVGPAVEVTTSAPLRGRIELTLPYDDRTRGTAGAAVDDLVVVQLTDDRRTYRELRPVRVDPDAHTVTVTTTTTSTFFVCTAGIEVTQPRVRRDAAGAATAWASGPEVTIAGRLADDRARVTLLDPVTGAPFASRSGWQALGWFDVEGVPLAPRQTHVRIRAAVDGLLPHECDITIRDPAPPKRVTDPSRHYGPCLAIARDDTPFVTAVVGSGRFTGDDLLGPLDEWQRNWNRYGAYVYRPNAEATGWEWRALLPEVHFEEATARIAMGRLQALVTVPPAPGAPAHRRALTALANFLAARPDDRQAAAVVRSFLDAAGDALGLRTMSISSTVPLVAGADGTFSAAFVAATAEGLTAAADSSLGRSLSRLYSPLDAAEHDLRPVNVGQLQYVSGSFDRGVRREVVADEAWCATVRLATDPAGGEPIIAALEPQPDVESQPAARLVLHRRRSDGSWTHEVVSASAAIIDFDMVVTPAAAGETRVWFVAAVAGRQFDVKTHLRTIAREGPGWLVHPLEYAAPWDATMVLDLGLWPRVAVDADGTTAIVFAVLSLGRVTWFVGATEGELFRVTELAGSGHEALTGSPLPPTDAILQVDSPVNTSGLGLRHWAADVVPAGQGALWCAYGNGVANLARVTLADRQPQVTVVDVDRMTGFAPSLATRRDGAPAIAYQDPWGSGRFGPDARDDLVYWSSAHGNVVPPTALPLAPPNATGYFSVAHPAPYVPLACDRLAGTDPRALLASIVLHRQFDIVLVPGEGDDPLEHTDVAYAHPGVAHQLARLRDRPSVLALRIDNSAVDEDIERIEVATFTDPIGTIARTEIGQLDRGIMTATVLSALMGTGTRLSHTPPHVVVRQPGRAWDLVDPDAYSGGLRQEAQVYEVRDNGDELEIFLPPVITVIDRERRLDPETNRPTPCGLTVEQWDAFIRPLAGQLDIIAFDLPDVPGRLRRVVARGIRVTALGHHDPPNQQQGGARFTIEIPHFAALTANPDAMVWATEPSSVHLTFAPFVRDGWIAWWVRETEVRLGHVEVDVQFGFFDWLAVIVSIIPGLGFVFAAVDAIADSVATSAANDELRPPGTGNLQYLLGDVLQFLTDLHGADEPRPLEAVWMRTLALTTWWRARPRADDPPATSQLNVLPTAGVTFAVTTVGDPPVRRNVLITSDGAVPALLESVTVTGADFRVVTTPAWPSVLLPGTSVVLTVEYVPAAPVGFHSGRVDVRFNAGQQASVTLGALTNPAPEPRLRVVPERLQFGATNAGTPVRRDLVVHNDGTAPLHVAAVEIGGGLPAGVLTAETPTPFTVAPGGSAVITVRLDPPFGSPARLDAACTIVTDDPQRPRVDVAVTASVASGQLLVTPTLLAFPNAPTAADQPALPPGLPPTVHRGPTRMTTVYNLGAADITLRGPSLQALDASGAVSPHFTLWQADGSPLPPTDRLLRSGESLVIVAEFSAAAPGDHIANIEVRAIDPTQVPATARLEGHAI